MPALSPKLFAILLMGSLLLVAICTLLLVYLWGSRKNCALAKCFANTLEALLKPLEKSYTWIGSHHGFHASYRLSDERSARCTLLLAPRSNLLYYPLF